jgi:hypothetical protein
LNIHIGLYPFLRHLDRIPEFRTLVEKIMHLAILR